MVALSLAVLLAQTTPVAGVSPESASPSLMGDAVAPVPKVVERATIAPGGVDPGAATAVPAVPVAAAVTRWRRYSREASRRFGVPLAWIEAVMQAESGGMTDVHGHPATSTAGAMGLMQLMPRTWARTRAALDLGNNPYDPRDNILAGTFYLRQMYDRFGYPGLFGAYNCGPDRYAGWLAGGRPLPRETRAYLAQLTGSMPSSGASASALQASPARPAQRSTSIFALIVPDPAVSTPARHRAENGLFVPLTPAPAPSD